MIKRLTKGLINLVLLAPFLTSDSLLIYVTKVQKISDTTKHLSNYFTTFFHYFLNLFFKLKVHSRVGSAVHFSYGKVGVSLRQTGSLVTGKFHFGYGRVGR